MCDPATSLGRRLGWFDTRCRLPSDFLPFLGGEPLETNAAAGDNRPRPADDPSGHRALNPNQPNQLDRVPGMSSSFHPCNSDDSDAVKASGHPSSTPRSSHDDVADDPLRALCREADRLFWSLDYAQAARLYTQARDLLPPELDRSETAAWLETMIGDAYLLDGQLERARHAYQRAFDLADAPDNPYLLLRLGQTAFDLGDVDQARAHLARAWELGGPDLFDEEEPRYRALLDQASPPPQQHE